MIPNAKEARSAIIRNTPEFARLCKNFSDGVAKSNQSGRMNFYISSEFNFARDEFCKLLEEKNYKWSWVNNNCLYIEF